MWNLGDIKRVNIWEFLEDVDKEIFTVNYNYYGVVNMLRIFETIVFGR